MMAAAAADVDGGMCDRRRRPTAPHAYNTILSNMLRLQHTDGIPAYTTTTSGMIKHMQHSASKQPRHSFFRSTSISVPAQHGHMNKFLAHYGRDFQSNRSGGIGKLRNWMYTLPNENMDLSQGCKTVTALSPVIAPKNSIYEMVRDLMERVERLEMHLTTTHNQKELQQTSNKADDIDVS